MSVYVDDAFCSDDPKGWGKWTGGGHMQADTLDELHAFAAAIGLKRAWFQSRPGRPSTVSAALARIPSEHGGFIARPVVELIDEGFSPDEIARKLRMDRGAVSAVTGAVGSAIWEVQNFEEAA